MRIPARSAVSALLVWLTACSGSGSTGASAYGAGDPALAAPAPGMTNIDPFLSNGVAVMRALDAIAARSGKPLRVTSMNADQVNGLSVDVQEPKKHINVDHYVVAIDGTLSGPTPVRLMSMTGGPVTVADVDLKAFDPKAIGFARLERTVRETITKSHFPDARISQWEIDGTQPDDRRYLYFEAARGRPVAVVDPSLKILRVGF